VLAQKFVPQIKRRVVALTLSHPLVMILAQTTKLLAQILVPIIVSGWADFAKSYIIGLSLRFGLLPILFFNSD
jgi:hypothetical protein